MSDKHFVYMGAWILGATMFIVLTIIVYGVFFATTAKLCP